MKHLLDTNLLITGIVIEHPHHSKAKAWMEGKELVVCPMVETGFVRIMTGKAIGSTMEKARTSLTRFLRERKVEFIPDDLRALDTHPRTAPQVTDHYLAGLAAKHGMTLATLDQGIKLPSVEVIL